ncbi:hypothetical protein [Haliangium sp.]|uniref:hypothetical protein n=1 Tax=Haliangium sp. TaxID=2663208 RepID=UPI003D0C7599
MRALLLIAIVAGIVYFAITVKLGDRTLLGHIQNISRSDEAQELVDGIEESSGPMVERIKRGLQAGVEEAARELPDAGVPAAP